jgi:glucose/arabinose dehydrogenase
VSILASGLSNPWDVTWVGDLLLFNERNGKVWSKRSGAARRAVRAPLSDLFVGSEGGLMGMVADPAAASNKRFYVCYASRSDGGDVRVVRWRLTNDTTAVPDGSSPVVVRGLPLSSGRHSGCRLRFGPDGLLYVGTGDAAEYRNPQDRQSLGGKVLRVRSNGDIPRDNPFYSQGRNARYVFSYGHRNVQGLAFRPGTRELWSAEQGSDRDDEVNLISAGANYGWDPKGPGYNESVPMTDLKKFPSAKPAKWSSGFPTVATSGMTFLADSGWGRWQGAIAVALLKGKGIKLLFLDPDTKVLQTPSTREVRIKEVTPYGRIRTVQYGPDGALYFTSSNGSGDVVGKLSVSVTSPRLAEGTDVSPVAPSAVRTAGHLYAFIRTTDDRVEYKRSTNDGGTWPSGWTDTRLKSTSAPSVASSAAGRVDIVTRNADKTITHTWLVEGERKGQTKLGGVATNATISSVGKGTLDVFALRTDGKAFRKRFDGSRWSGWQELSGPRFTSRLGASAQPSTGSTLITARGTAGAVYERNVTASSNGSGWTRVDGTLWSGRALGDRYPSRPLIGMSRSHDGVAVLRRGVLVMALEQPISSEPDVVTRENGTWVMFASNGDRDLLVYDGRPGAYTATNLGGDVR